MKFHQLNRGFHRWASILVAFPVLLVIATGIILQVKKEFTWIQPATQAGTGTEPSLPFERILDIVTMVPEAEIRNWDDIDRLDVRPGKGMLKVRAKNQWEIQLDAASGDILQVAYRRSDLIEGLHDGSFFHDKAKLWVFLPNGLMLLAMWLTGMYLFILLYRVKRRRRRKQVAQED